LVVSCVYTVDTTAVRVPRPDPTHEENILKIRTLLIPVGLVAALAVPAGAAAAPPTKADKAEGKQECREMLRTVETRANLVELVKLEAKTNRRNAFGRCVVVRTSDANSERRTAFQDARAACVKLRPGRGTRGRPSDPSAYGKCVAAAARENQRQLDREQREESVNPAKTCRAKQETAPTAFEAKNAFGKCVSEEAQKQNDEEAAAEEQDQA